MASIFSGSLTPEERSKRSILVGNISNETTEEELRNVLLEFGPMVSFRFFNNSAGNQIGYAFCEYQMQDMAARAIYKLHNTIFKGQALKVATAASEKSREELESFLQGTGNVEIKQEPFTEMDVTTEKAPEEISKAVASLPPEQMFELMKQMKMCIENNPHEARNLLLQNPQLAYALLQAQVIMRIVDPEVATKILERPVGTSDGNSVSTSDADQSLNSVLTSSASANNIGAFPSGVPASMPQNANFPGISMPPMSMMPNAMDRKDFPSSGDQDMRQLFGVPNMGHMNGSEVDPRFRIGMDHRIMQEQNLRAQASRMISGSDPRGFQGLDPGIFQGPDTRNMQNSDPRSLPGTDPRMMQGPDPRIMQGPDVRSAQGHNSRSVQGLDPRMIPDSDPQAMINPDPRSIPVSDPRNIRSQDPRTSQLPDPRMMPVSGPDPRIATSAESRIVPGSKFGGMEGRLGPGDPRSAPLPDPRIASSIDPRIAPSIDPRIAPSADPRMPPADPRMLPPTDHRMPPSADPRVPPATDPRVLPIADPRSRQISDPRMKQTPDPRVMQGPEMGNLPPVSREDPRKLVALDDVPASTTHLPVGSRTPAIATTAAPGGALPSDSLPNVSPGSTPQDQEKAALIMQVLQLSDEQIAMLPPEQRQSILILKEQIARSHLAA